MKTFNYYLSLFIVMLSIASASAYQRQIGASADDGEKKPIVVQRSPTTQSPSFYVNIKVDHENGIYEEGDLMTVTAKTNKSGYLYIFVKDSEGEVYMLYPNKYQQDNRIEANRDVQIPDAKMDFDIETQAPFGKEIIQAIVTLKPLDEKAIKTFKDDLFNKIDAEAAKNIEKCLGRRTAIRHPAIVARAYPNTSRTSAQNNTDENDFAEFSIEIRSCPKGRVPQVQKKRIFVGIGVSQYEDPTIPALPACKNDIIAMGNYFANNGDVDLDRSVLLVDKNVTKEQICTLFNSYLPNQTNPGDEIIIYWTGHGARFSDVDGDETSGALDATLVLYDSKRNDPKTHLVDDEFGRMVQNLSGRKVLFLLDSCYSGGMGNNTKGLFSDSFNWNFGFRQCAIMKDLGQTNLALIASSSKSETSLIINEKKMSVMTYFMVECLENNPSITHKGMFDSIKGKVSDYVQSRFHASQSVSIQDELESPMVLNPGKKTIKSWDF